MTKDKSGLSRRERQIMDVVYRLGRATVQEVLEGLETPPSYSAVRATLRLLEERGHLRHDSEGAKYVYLPAQPKSRASRQALRNVLEVYFDESLETALAALLDLRDRPLPPEELDALQRLIDEARRQGR